MADEAKEKRIKKEVRRLKKILGKSSKVSASEHLINNAAFMAISLEDLREEINEKGWTEEYRNGANQSGLKKSAAAECYTMTFKNYLATMKQLADITPEEVEVDELALFNSLK